MRAPPIRTHHDELAKRLLARWLGPLGETQVDVREGNAKLVTLEEGTTLEVVTHALNELGATPRDIIAIMQALKAAGALHAELIIL